MKKTVSSSPFLFPDGQPTNDHFKYCSDCHQELGWGTFLWTDDPQMLVKSEKHELICVCRFCYPKRTGKEMRWTWD